MATVFKRGGKANRGGYYYAAWFDYRGKRQVKCTKTTDKATAERIAAKYEGDAALRREGVVDAELDAIAKESRKSIEEHLPAFTAKLHAKGASERHIKDTLADIRHIAAFPKKKWTCVADINADDVNAFASRLRTDDAAARTIGRYLQSIKQFARWLTEHNKLTRNPLASVKKPNAKSDRRYERRMLLPDEWKRLERATESGPTHHRMTGSERAMLYAMAIQTGLRAWEFRTLTCGKFQLETAPYYVLCKASGTKNKKEARQYIQAELAGRLRSYFQGRSAASRAFHLPSKYNMAEMLGKDVNDAKAAWIAEAGNNAKECRRREESDFLALKNAEGYVLDFHALRHTCGAWLSMTGVHPKVVQTLMRHGSITLTMDTYGHLFPGQDIEAAGKFAELMARDGAAHGAAVGRISEGVESNGNLLGAIAQKCTVGEKPGKNKEKSGPKRAAANKNEMRRLGLEPRTYGLKVRCSTD